MRLPFEDIWKNWRRPKKMWPYSLLAAIGVLLLLMADSPPERGEEKPSAGILTEAQERYLSLRARQWSAHLTESPNTPEDLRERLKREPAFRERLGQFMAILEWYYLYRFLPTHPDTLKKAEEIAQWATVHPELTPEDLCRRIKGIPPFFPEKSSTDSAGRANEQKALTGWMGDWTAHLYDSRDVPSHLRTLLESDSVFRQRFALCGVTAAAEYARSLLFDDQEASEGLISMARLAAKDADISMAQLVRIANDAMQTTETAQ